MKKITIVFGMLALALACEKAPSGPSGDVTFPVPDEPIEITSPTPATVLAKVDLSATQQRYVKSGNALAFRLLQGLYAADPANMVCSPLSLQYALAMTANGAAGETLNEIITTLGYGSEGIDALNAYCNLLMNQLPAVDPDVVLKVVDAMLVKEDYPVQEAFRQVLASSYYAPVEYMSFADPMAVLSRINDWASRNTNGLINPILREISPDAVGFIMNALYFKAKWADETLFKPNMTLPRDFTRKDGNKVKVNMMAASEYLPYGKFDGFQAVGIPYANGKYSMYVLLPDAGADFGKWVAGLDKKDFSTILGGMKKNVNVELLLPKFDVSGDFLLNDVLQAMGIRLAFDADFADFSRMFDKPGESFRISRVIQKAKLSLAEWGTEAAAVTVVEMEKATSVGPGGESVKFYANHPFVFVLAENTSGAILFEGVYQGD